MAAKMSSVIRENISVMGVAMGLDSLLVSSQWTVLIHLLVH